MREKRGKRGRGKSVRENGGGEAVSLVKDKAITFFLTMEVSRREMCQRDGREEEKYGHIPIH